MKKYKMLEKAMRDYPTGTKFKSALTNHEYVSTGIFHLTGHGSVSCDIEQNKAAIVYYCGDDKWATIIPEQPKSILSDKVAIQVQNEREFKLLMEHYEGKGWRHATMSSPIDLYHLITSDIPYEDEWKSLLDDNGYTIIPFSDFAKESGITVPKFVMRSEDGKDLYEGDDIVKVSYTAGLWNIDGRDEFKKLSESLCVYINDNHHTSKAFSTKEAAEKWIAEQNKPKEVQVKLFHNGIGKVTDKHVRIRQGLSKFTLMPSDIEELYRALKLLTS